MSGQPAPWVRVVIVNYNAGDLLAATVEGLAHQTFADFEAVIVDNGSTDGSIARLCLPDQRFSILPADGNIGFAAGCNLGVRGTEARWLAMLNPDAVPEPGWLAALHAATLRYPDAALFGSTQLMADCPSVLDGGGDNYSIFGIAWRGGYGGSASQVTGDIEVFSPCAAAALYRRDVFESAGGFAESFFCYLEDVDLGFRLRLAGHRAVQVTEARVCHAGSAIAGRHSPFTLYHSTRNGVYLMLRCLPMSLLLLALPLYQLAQAWLAIRTNAPAARFKGLIDGLGAVPRLWAERRAIQQGRKVGTAAIAGMVVWDPRKLSRRRIVPLRSASG